MSGPNSSCDWTLWLGWPAAGTRASGHTSTTESRQEGTDTTVCHDSTCVGRHRPSTCVWACPETSWMRKTELETRSRPANTTQACSHSPRSCFCWQLMRSGGVELTLNLAGANRRALRPFEPSWGKPKPPRRISRCTAIETLLERGQLQSLYHTRG